MEEEELESMIEQARQEMEAKLAQKEETKDLNWMFEQAKETLLEAGDHPPTLFVEYQAKGEACLDMCMLLGFTGEKRYLFTFGVSWGEGHPEAEIEKLTFISEVWTSEFSKERKAAYFKKIKRPVNDPHRKESLLAMVSILVPAPDKPQLKREVYRAEILRPGAGVVDLAPTEKIPVEAFGDQLLHTDHFLSGWQWGRMSEQQRQQMMKETQAL